MYNKVAPSYLYPSHSSHYAMAASQRSGTSASSSSDAMQDMQVDLEAGNGGTSLGHDGNSGLRIAFKDLTFSVPSTHEKGQMAYLLNNVSGFFEPNQMAALMGPSGSGKTTLLDVLAGRKTVGKTEGMVRFGGREPSSQFLRRYTGYVEQFDTLLGDLTVYEMLLYTAELKRPLSEPLREKKEQVDKLLDKLGLDVCRDVKIGDPMSKGISGGQAKRVNIGIALITNPRVLFLDEPTSGLDSFTGNEVMKVVKSLAAGGTTICATIHSPTASTFALFDSLLVLVRGQMVYFGPQGKPALEYAWSNWPGAEPQPGELIANPAEWLVDSVTWADRRKEGQVLAEAYNRSSLKRSNDERLDGYLQEKSLAIPEAVQQELAVTRATVTPFWWGLITLLKYRSVRNFKNPAWLGPRVADKLLVSLIILTLYLGIGDNYKQSNLVNQVSALFMWALLPAFGAASYVPAIVLERQLFIRERADGIYRVVTYLGFKLIEEITLATIVTLIFAGFVFPGVDFQGSFAVFWLVYFLDLCVGIVLAYLIASLSPNMDVANAALPAFVVIWLFFAGMLSTFDSIPDYWYWYSFLDPLRYSFSALMINQYEKSDPIFAGDQTILQYFGVKHMDKWAQVGYLSLFIPVIMTLCWLSMTYVKHQKR